MGWKTEIHEAIEVPLAKARKCSDYIGFNAAQLAAIGNTIQFSAKIFKILNIRGRSTPNRPGRDQVTGNKHACFNLSTAQFL
jgi:hypothetical protein